LLRMERVRNGVAWERTVCSRKDGETSGKREQTSSDEMGTGEGQAEHTALGDGHICDM